WSAPEPNASMPPPDGRRIPIPAAVECRDRADQNGCPTFTGDAMHARNRCLAVLSLIVTVLPVLAWAAPQKVASVEGITEYRLDNGLRVLLYRETSRPTVTVNLTMLVGSRHEGYGESGMA